MNVHWPTFICALAVGLFFVYVTQSQKQVVVVYPTPENVDRIQYKDRAGTCHEFSAASGTCPKDAASIQTIPVQSRQGGLL